MPIFSVVDGTSKEVSLQDKSEAWSSWALVIFLGIALTLLIISIAIGLLAKMNSNTATQQRRQRAAADWRKRRENARSPAHSLSEMKFKQGPPAGSRRCEKS